MSKEIDERVVEMQFDNSQFERNVSTSMSTIEKLKQSLNFSGAAKGLDEIDVISRNLNMDYLAGAVEAVGVKFSTMEYIAISALNNITNKVINSGERLVKSLSVDQVSAGWTKYGDKVSSVQTIMSATANTWEQSAKLMEFEGTQLEYVNSQLEKLNWFSDETSYSFTDMTNNIGKFTSNGVALDQAVTAMEGISSWAAKSGANVNEASRAMYNLSQAISVGSVKLMDWKSIENANMATQEFKKTAIDTAVALGTLKKQGDGTLKTIKDHEVSVNNFNEALADEWFTSEVLLSTLDKYGSTAVRLSEIYEEYGITASQFLSGMDDFNEGNKTITQIAKKLGMEADDLKPLFEELSSAEYELGLASFRAAQEAKTFMEAISATKDAVSTGWMTTFEHIFGNYEEAKVLWTDMANALWDVFAASGETRNEILSIWKEDGGRDDLIEAFWNLWDAIDSLTTPIKNAFGEVFPSTIERSAEKLYFFTKKVKDFTANLTLSDETAEKLKNTFKGIFSALSIGKQLLRALTSGFKRLMEPLLPMSGTLLDITSDLGLFITGLDESIKHTAKFQVAVDKMVDFLLTIPEKIDNVFKMVTGITLETAFKKIVKIVNDAYARLKEAFDGFKDIDLSGVEGVVDKVETRFQPLTNLFKGLASICNVVFKVFTALFPFIGKLVNAVGIALQKIGGALVEAVTNADFNMLLDLVNSGVLFATANKIQKFFISITSVSESAWTSFRGIKGALKNISVQFEYMQANLQASTIMKIAIAIGIVAASLAVLSMLDSAKLTLATGAITALFYDLTAAMQKVSVIQQFNFKGVSNNLLSLSIAIFILANACKKLAELSSEELIKGVLAITALTEVMVLSSLTMSQCAGKLINGSTSLIVFAVAINILTSAVRKLSELSVEDLAKGLVGTILLMKVLADTLTKSNFDKISLSQGIGLVLIAASMNVMADAIAKIGSIPVMNIIVGLLSLKVILEALSDFVKEMKGAKRLVSVGLSMVLIASSMLIFANAMNKIAAIPFADLAKAILAMSVVLLEVSLAMDAIPATAPLAGIGMIAMAAGLVILAEALKLFGSLSVGEIVKGLIAMTIALAEVAVVSNLMIAALPGAAAMLIFASGLVVLAGALKILGSMSLWGIVKSLIGLTAALVIVGTLGAVLGAVSPLIAAFGLSLILVSTGLLALGIGITLLSAGLTSLAVSGVAGIASFITIVTMLIGMIPAVVVAIANGLLLIIKTLGEGGPIIFEAVKNIGVSFMQALGVIIAEALILLDDTIKNLLDHLPSILSNLFAILVDTLQQFAKNVYPIIVALIDTVLNAFRAITDKLPEIIQVGVDFVISFIEGMSDAIDNNSERFRDAIIKLFKSVLAAIATLLGIKSDSSQSFEEIAVAIVNGLVDSIVKLTKVVVKAFVTLIKKIISTVKEYGPKVAQAGKDLLQKAWDGMNNMIGKFFDIGKNILLGIIDGLSSGISWVVDKVTDVSNNIKDAFCDFFGIHSPSKVFYGYGMNLDQGLANGIDKYSGLVTDATEDMGQTTIDTMKDSMSRIADYVNDGLDAEPTIAPVMDLTNVTKGVESINGMMNNTKAMSLASNIDVSASGNLGRMSNLMSDAQEGFMSGNSSVISAINSMIEHIAGMLDEDDKEVALYVDGKKLASSLAKPMNRELNILLQRGGN